MKFKLGQKVKYKKVVRKIFFSIKEKDFDDTEIIAKDRMKIVELTRERYGFIVGKRNIAKKAEYKFDDNNPVILGSIKYYRTEIITVYKVAYDMAHTNYVLEKDLIEVN